MSGKMKMVKDAFIDEIYTLVYRLRHFKGKKRSFVKKESKFTKNLREKGFSG
jgi:hypothetical protein